MEKAINTAFLLAGGKSSRMGTDKGLALLRGRPVVQHILETLKPLFSDIVIVTSNEEYSRFGFPLIADLIPDKGPMGGILTALEHNTSEACFIVGCDLPFVSEELIRDILTHYRNESALCVQVGDTMQPLCGVYHQRIKTELHARIEQDKLKVMDIFTVNNTRVLPQPDKSEQELTNINTPEELAAWNKRKDDE